MRRLLNILIIVLTVSIVSIVSFGQSTVKLYINGNEPKLTISKHIFGHFSEHLGR